MNEKFIRDVLERLQDGQISPDEAIDSLRDLPYKSLGFANVDNHRSLRTGFPEVIYGQGKTPEQIRDIFAELVDDGHTVFATRASEEAYRVVAEMMPEAVYYKEARIISLLAADQDVHTDGTVAVVSAGTADIPIAEEAAVCAELLGNRVIRVYDVGVAGIHRLFDRLEDIRSADVIVVVAGMEGALASVVGGLVGSPVIAVPTSVGYGSNFEGLSALLSMLNSCSNGVTVVNIDNGFGAAYAASVITKCICNH